MLMMCMSPKIRVRPAAMRKRIIARDRPLSVFTIQKFTRLPLASIFYRHRRTCSGDLALVRRDPRDKPAGDGRKVVPSRVVQRLQLEHPLGVEVVELFLVR